MKVLFLARATLFTQPGGDTLQVEKTAEYLRDLGCEVVITLSGDDFNPGGFDLIHFFNLIRPADARSILHSNTPLVISSIYHDYSEYDSMHRGFGWMLLNRFIGKFGLEYLKTLARWANGSDRFPGWRFILRGQKKSMKMLLSKAKHLLTTSQQEAELIQKELGELPPWSKVSLGIEHLGEPTNSGTERRGVFCAARIEGPKNQWRLIKALQGSGISLKLSGNVASNQSGYMKRCMELAGNEVEFIGRVSREELERQYQQCKVHALISYYETTGLSTLEAMASGAQVVITDRGAQKEIFGAKAFYCDPDNESSIAQAVRDAMASTEDHSQWVRNNFSWDRAAKEILDIYKALMPTDQP